MKIFRKWINLCNECKLEAGLDCRVIINRREMKISVPYSNKKKKKVWRGEKKERKKKSLRPKANTIRNKLGP